MNQTSPPPDGNDFDPQRVRTITEMRRSADDRVVAGVCAGAARYLNIDPVILRVVIAVLTFVGFAGPIIYLAAWFLLPAEGAKQSIAADWLNLGQHETQVRTLGLIGAGVIALAAVVGGHQWVWSGFGLLWLVVPIAILYWVFAVLPRRKKEALMETSDVVEYGSPDQAAPSPTAETVPPAPPKTPRSHALTILTLSATAIVLGALAMWDTITTDTALSWQFYVATALVVVALGLLVGAFVGDGVLLVPLGIILAVALAVSSAIPNVSVGEMHESPVAASDVQSSYTLGVGDFELDLRNVAQPDQLLGRTIRIKQGIGNLRVIVPEGVKLRVKAHVGLGNIRYYDQEINGANRRFDSGGDATALTLRPSLRVGQIEVR